MSVDPYNGERRKELSERARQKAAARFELSRRIVAYVRANPEVLRAEVARHFRVSAGRVNKALADSGTPMATPMRESKQGSAGRDWPGR